MTAFDRAWSIVKGRGDLTTLLDRILPEESKKSIMWMNLSTAKANMDYDEDPSVNFLENASIVHQGILFTTG